MELFQNGAEAREVLENWREEYNKRRPHSSLDDQTPEEFAARAVSVAWATPQQHLQRANKEGILT